MGKDQELLEAARNGNIPVVEKILSQRAKRSGPLASLRRGPGANVQDSSGYSALHHAALNGHKEVVQLLLAHEASTNILDVKGSSPLHLAAWTGNVDIVRLLLCHGPSVPSVNLTTKENETALHWAAQYGHTAVVSQLLEHSCDPTIRNSREETALDLAAQYGRLETVELLVRTHPELIQPYSRGQCNLFRHTPLHLASRNGHKAVVAVLLAAGLDVNVRTAGGTALHEAALCGKVEVVRTLLDGGVDLGIRDSQHNTVMDLLGQFPPHVTHDITAIINKHRTSGMRDSMDPDDRDGLGNPLPPIPVPDSTLGSPYENVRVTRSGGRVPLSSGGGGGLDSSSPSTSPTHWEFYHSTKARQGSTGDPTSVASDSGVYQTPPAPKSLDSSFLSDDLSLFHHHHQQQQRDPDQMSVSSTTSSTGGPSPRDRRCEGGSASIYMPMAPGHGHSHSHSHSPGSNSKVSPTPPKKPPRRNLSVSPTHLQPSMTMSADSGAICGSGGGAYEYLFLARSGVRSHGDLDDLQCLGSQTLGGGRRELRHQGRSVDQYVDMKLRQSIRVDQQQQAAAVTTEAFHTFRGRSEDIDDSLGRKHLVREQPVAITSMYENFTIKTQNPRRKLRRHPHNNDRVYENFEPTQHRGVASEAGKTVSPAAPVAVDTSVSVGQEDNPTFVSSAYITLKSSQESLLDEPCNGKRHPTTPTDGEQKGKLKKVQVLPLSPTHYQQPPTPDHPPPSALQAEKSIHERIRPLSQEYKRRSRDIETETEEDLLLFPSLDASSGSLSSSVSLSDKSVSTDNNVEEFFGDAPFAGLFKGSTTPGPDGGSRSSPAERPKTLRRLKNVYDNTSGSNGKVEDGEEVVTKRTTSSSRSGGSGTVSTGSGSGPGMDKGQSLSILSPFDEQEEWAKISEIMASFGTGLVRESVFVTELEKEFQTRLGLNRSASSSPVAAPGSTGVGASVSQWLFSLGLADYESLFRNNGFDDLEFINGVLEDQDLKEMGIDNERDRETIIEAARNLPCKAHQQQNANLNNNNNNPRSSEAGLEHNEDANEEDTSSTATGSAENEGDQQEESAVDRWLHSIRLDVYKETFRKHLYTDMDRVRRIWEVELTAVLEIHRVGHRKRILASVSGQQPRGSHGPNLEDINADLNLLKSNIQQLKEEIREKLPVVPSTGTLRHSHKKSRPAPPPPMSTNGSVGSSDLEIRAPSELLVGVPATLTTQWRHRPHVLVAGSVNYVANYLGSTVVKELRGTESTKKSIQKLKKSSSTKDAKATPDIILAISYRGVKFLNTITKELVCEHEIRNIHCACQDADDLTHFAYITKDHTSKSHYCHVFCVQTMDQATEVILTLGQAFEVAYQMALRDQFTGGRGGNNNNNVGGHMRSQSATHILAPPNVSLPGTNSSSTSSGQQSNHSRSLSVNEIKVNGQGQSKDMSASQQVSASNKESNVGGENQTLGGEQADMMTDASKGSQVSQAPIVLTEEL